METNPTLSKVNPFDAYEAKAGCYDEFRAPDGALRPAWSTLIGHFHSLGESGLYSRAAEAEQMLRENGSTFLASIDGGENTRPWQLSCVPLVIDEPTWSKIEAGLKQRVRILEAVLADLLGPQQLIRQRVLPAELLSANPTYARAFHELPATGRHRLHLTAADLARSTDGSWWVTGHRTRAPSGLGYALENRVVCSRVLQKIIHQNNVPRLASFFSRLQEHVASLAPRVRDNPRVGILTPGQSSYRYFEDVFLARYLGYTLVHGRDLAVRGNCLNLKTLGGLLPIEVLWRNISDDQCDPLELDPASTQGVTGMLQTIRGGNLSVLNEIGSMLAEMPALLPFLAASAKALLGEELILPSIASYWCGGEKERRFVLANLDRLLVRPAFSITGADPVDPCDLSAPARAELVAQINANPQQYIAQERPSRSCSPVWLDGQLRSWHVALRTFHLQTVDDIHVMPGGLVRVSDQPETLDGSPKGGQLGQDCWLLRGQEVDSETTLLPPVSQPVRLARSGDELPSRVAENYFWLGRYLERTEAIARILRTTLTILAGESEIDELPQLRKLVAALAAVGQIEPDYAIEEFRVTLSALEQELPRSIFDEASVKGVRSGAKGILRNALALRDRLPSDADPILTSIEFGFSRGGRPATPNMGGAILWMDKLTADLLAFSGLASESMTRTHGWRFLQLGRRIERAYQTCELLSAAVAKHSDGERPILESVLKTTDCLMTYRSRYLAQLQPAAALDLLVTDETNPRSIRFQLQRVADLIRELPDKSEPGLGSDERLAESLLHHVLLSDPTELAMEDADGTRQSLLRLMQYLIDGLPSLSDAIAARYLIHTGTQELTGRRELDSPGAKVAQ